MTRVHDSGVFEARFAGQREIVDYRLRVTYPGRPRASTIDDPYRYGRVITEYDVYLFSQGKHTRIYDKLGAHLMRDRQRRRRAFRRLGAQRRSRQRRRRLQRVGRPAPPDAAARSRPASGRSSSPGSPAGERYKFEIRSNQHGELLLKSDPYGFLFREAAAVGVDRRAPRAHLGRRAVVRRSRRLPRLAQSADGDLRSAPRIVGARPGGTRPFADLSRDGRAAHPLREGDGLHAHRAAAGDGASVLRVLGVPGHRASSRRARATARRTTSRRSSTPAIRTASP